MITSKQDGASLDLELDHLFRFLTLKQSLVVADLIAKITSPTSPTDDHYRSQEALHGQHSQKPE
jgi:hypothetical protein